MSIRRGPLVFSCVPAYGAGWARARQVPGVGASHFLDLAYQSSVQLPRWQTHVPKAQPLRSDLAFFHTSPAWRWGCQWPVSTSLASLPLYPAAGVAPCVLIFVSFCASAPASPMAQVAPSSLLLFSADPSLKPCSYNYLFMKPVCVPSSQGCWSPPTLLCVRTISPGSSLRQQRLCLEETMEAVFNPF